MNGGKGGGGRAPGGGSSASEPGREGAPGPIGRRRFLGAVIGGGVAVALGGCASVASVPVRPVEGRVRLVLEDYPALQGRGGFLRLRTEGDGRSIYVLSLEDGSHAALSPVCTHQGCTVDVEGRHLVCPCHGSTYTREGEVVRGPAPLPLQRFPVRTEDGGVLIIDTEV